MPGRIDVHAHLGGVVADLFASGFTLGRGYQMSERWTAQPALGLKDRQATQAIIMSVRCSLAGTAEDPDRGRRFCRQLDEQYAGIIGVHAGRFGAFAAIAADDPDSALGEMTYALVELHLDGVLLHSNAAGGKYVGGPCYDPVLAELARRRVPAFVRPTNSPCIEQLALGRSVSVEEFTLDTARGITDAIFTGAFRSRSSPTVMVARCGGPLPTVGWRIAEHTEMGMGPDDKDIDPAHVTDVLRGLCYETALAGAAHSLLPGPAGHRRRPRPVRHRLARSPRGHRRPQHRKPHVVRRVQPATAGRGRTGQRTRPVPALPVTADCTTLLRRPTTTPRRHPPRPEETPTHATSTHDRQPLMANAAPRHPCRTRSGPAAPKTGPDNAAGGTV